MNSILATLNKNFVYAIYAILFFFIIGFFKDCSNSKRLKKLEDKTEKISQRLDSIPSKDEVNKTIKIEGLKTSKRTLYDWNAVIRTAERPDDIMNNYDKEIEILNKK